MSLSHSLSLVLATDTSSLPRPLGLPRSSMHFHSGGDAEPPHTHHTARHDMDTRHIIRIRALSLRERGQGYARKVSPSHRPVLLELNISPQPAFTAGIHASSRPPAAIEPPPCSVLRRLTSDDVPEMRRRCEPCSHVLRHVTRLRRRLRLLRPPRERERARHLPESALSGGLTRGRRGGVGRPRRAALLLLVALRE